VSLKIRGEGKRVARGDRRGEIFSKTSLYFERLCIYLKQTQGLDKCFYLLCHGKISFPFHILRKMIVSNQVHFKVYLS
jgi:hypothetical protein